MTNTTASRFCLLSTLLLLATNAAASTTPITIDFEADATGAVLVNGRQLTNEGDISAVEGGGEEIVAVSNLFRLRSPQFDFEFASDFNADFGAKFGSQFDSDLNRTGNGGTDPDRLGGFNRVPLGLAIFNSAQSAAATADDDLLVDMGNLLILQNGTLPGQNTPGVFNNPDDESGDDNDGGYIIFEFFEPTALLSIGIIDLDDRPNSGETEGLALILTDVLGRTRTFAVSDSFTGELGDPTEDGPLSGTGSLSLIATATQTGPGGGTARVVEDEGFDPASVVSLEIALTDITTVAFDNLVFSSVIPEPATGVTLLLGVALAASRRRRSA